MVRRWFVKCRNCLEGLSDWPPLGGKKRHPRTRARVTGELRWNLRRTTWVNGTVLGLEKYAIFSLSRRSRDHLRVMVVDHITQPVAGRS